MYVKASKSTNVYIQLYSTLLYSVIGRDILCIISFLFYGVHVYAAFMQYKLYGGHSSSYTFSYTFFNYTFIVTLTAVVMSKWSSFRRGHTVLNARMFCM